SSPAGGDRRRARRSHCIEGSAMRTTDNCEGELWLKKLEHRVRQMAHPPLRLRLQCRHPVVPVDMAGHAQNGAPAAGEVARAVESIFAGRRSANSAWRRSSLLTTKTIAFSPSLWQRAGKLCRAA